MQQRSALARLNRRDLLAKIRQEVTLFPWADGIEDARTNYSKPMGAEIQITEDVLVKLTQTVRAHRKEWIGFLNGSTTPGNFSIFGRGTSDHDCRLTTLGPQ